MNELSVSVLVLAYNHQAFIAQSLNSILMQQTNFPVTIVIGEDHSTDNTFAICKEYQGKYPQRIKLLERSSNIGMMRNTVDTLLQCEGKYIAICEGDDYWTDVHKLQKQVDILEQQPNTSLCFHIGNDLEDGQISINRPFTQNSYTFKDFAAYGCFVKTVSVVFRNSDLLREIMQEKWVLNLSGGDQLIYLLLLINGNIAVPVNQVMGIYRHHSGGIWSSQTNKKRALSLFNDIILYKKHLPLSKKQMHYLNWQLKKVLVSSLSNYNSGQINPLLRARNIFVNRVLFSTGPTTFSGVLVDHWLKNKNSQLD